MQPKFYDIDKFGIVRIYKFKGVMFEAHWGEFINKEHLFTWLKSRSWVKPSTLNDIYFDILKLTGNHLKLASNYYDKRTLPTGA